MKKTFTKVLAVCMCLCMLVGSLVACGNKNDDVIVIGVTGPLTGGASIYGIAVRNAAQLAVDEINAAGGLNGINFKLEMRDDEHKPENVANLYTNLVEEAGMQVSLGTVTTKPGLEFKNLSKEDNVFFLTPSATGDLIPEYANGYQMCFADSNQGTAAAKFFNENYVGKKVGIFFKADDEYSTGINNNFKAALADSFKADLKEASFTGEASTFDSQIQILKDCEIVFMPIYYTPASQFMKQANSVDNSITTYYGCDGFDGIDAIDGFDIKTIPQEISMLSHFNSTATEGSAADFIKKYNDKYDEAKEPLNQFGAAAYDCVYAIYEALKVAVANGKEVDGKTSASDMCEILKEVFNSDSFEFRGITGKCDGNEKSHISWSADGTVVKEAIKYIVKEKNA
ncbi:MAG: ABC transporter substrate-binding protein [Clostridia bacterium]|nr:ABC transporter substrate-binding protein [Clostridia bacterium]